MHPAQPSAGPPSTVEAATPARPQRTVFGIFPRIARTAGSLQAALLLLPTFAAVLALGTFVESIYDTRVAHELVYRTWWFVTLLALLGLNIFCAAFKKRPWQRQHTGFLITHVGLLTLVASGVVTSVAGVHGAMTLVDTEDGRFHRFGIPAANVLRDPHRDVIRVRRPQAGREDVAVRPFEPGPLPWNPVENGTFQAPTFARGLNWLAHPWPRSWTLDLGRGAYLEVIDYQPHALEQPFAPAASNDELVFPALAVDLTSPTTGALAPTWIGFHGAQRSARLGPGLIEFLGRNVCAEQVREFHHPPSAENAGNCGTLVLGLAGEITRWDVADSLGKDAAPVGKSGWRVRITQYQPNYHEPASAVPADPGLAIELTGPAGKISLALVARQAGELFPMGKEPVSWQSLPGLWTWYHPPDLRYGDPSLKAVLQFVTDADGAVHYRSFAGGGAGALRLEKTGIAAAGVERMRIWDAMSWRFQLAQYLPRAVPGPHFVPVERHLGQEDLETTPAIRCRLTQGQHVKEFWLGRTDHELTSVLVGNEDFLIGFNPMQTPLDFALRLVRAEQTTDKGSGLPASQSSFVLLTDPDRKIQGENRIITLNEPLAHRGYKFYQSGYQPLGVDGSGRPVSRSVLSVRYDPGLWLKYAGSTMVALGIACMFYMKAYFFKFLAKQA